VEPDAMFDRRKFIAFAPASAFAWPFVAPANAEAQTFEVAHTEAEWRKLLTPNQFAVLRQAGTERPFTSPLLEEHRKGVFACAGCGRDLFASETKFDSGTGWPSFWKPLDGAVLEETDTATAWTAPRCRAADAAVISAMSSTTDRSRRACAIA
jgi:peptide-methionine (R)-S-oxide reductase